MNVWILYTYDDRVEGVYTAAGKAKKEEQLLEEALRRRATVNSQYASEIAELKELRQPYITEADAWLEKEKAAKEAMHTGNLKEARKQRKVLLRQAEHITYDIKRREEKILKSQRMTKAEIMSSYGTDCYWEDYCLEGE